MKGTPMNVAQSHRLGTRVISSALAMALGTVEIGLCGCALHKPPSQMAIVNQALPKATPLPPAWSSGTDTANVTDDWVKSFKDDELGVVVREAIANNLDLRQSAARVEQARQSVIVVGAQLKPQVGAIIGGATTRSSDTNSTDEFQSNTEYATVSWEVDV